MKRMLFVLLASSLGWADPLVYHFLPSPDCRLSVVGRATVITDARGFFVGYYRPLRPPAPVFIPPPKPGPYCGLSGDNSSGYDGYGGYGGYGGYDGDCNSGPASSSGHCSGGSSGGSDYASNSGSPLCSPDYGFGR